MADITMLEAAKHSKSALEAFVTKIIVESSPILEYLPMKTIVGPTLKYFRETALGDISFRGVGGTYTPDAGVINPLHEDLVIMGGEVFIDNFDVATMSNLLDLKTTKYKMKARQTGFKFSEAFFEGDTAVDPYSFDGVRKRLTGNQVITMATDGAKLSTTAATSFQKLDELVDAVVGDDEDKVLFMNTNSRRAITRIVREQTGTMRITVEKDAFGKQQMGYSGIPIRLIRREDDNSSFFGFDETTGSSDITCSIYCVRFGTEFIHGIQNASLPSVKDFGEIEARPGHLGRIEWFNGLALKHPRSAARLKGILTE